MTLKNQIYLHSLETKDFYTDEEMHVNEMYFKALRLKNKLKNKLQEMQEFIHLLEEKEAVNHTEEQLLTRYTNKLGQYEARSLYVNAYVNKYKSELSILIESYPQHQPRILREDALKITNQIGVFESSLTRLCKFKNNEITTDLFVIRIFHYQILKSIIHNGFYYQQKKYKYFTSSAGQIRTKKIVAIKEDLYAATENAITCGLSLNTINRKGGINANKYQAYLALANSASSKWTRFNIDRIVVVDDFSTKVNSVVDYIDSQTFEITRQRMDIPIEHMDGCGIMLPTVSKKSFMFRMPWMKGLLTPFDFKKFIEEKKCSPKIIDIYGKEYDILADNINIILTKSQFKMWKFYDSWDDYKDKFKTYNCESAKLNIEDIGAKASMNYQMLQTLVTMTDEELQDIAAPTINDILTLGKDKKTMLRVLGAVKENSNMNYFQKSLLLYPELLSDSHCREVIKNKKRKLIKEAKAGKLNINGYYTFIIPDLYAFCEWLFLKNPNPNGLLQADQVYCNIFNAGDVDILRAPHLYKEHAVRNNIKDSSIADWFITKGIYTSVKDAISKILQFDNDGDKSLVVQNPTLIAVAKREMKDIVPLYYEMHKAEDKILDNDIIYHALTSAYKANIGIISNDISKIWNSEKPNLQAIKWLCMYNNFVIDYAKTLYLPEKPKDVEAILKGYSKEKLPYFFKYAKDKEENQILPLLSKNPNNLTTVNKLNFFIPNKPIRFKNTVGEFDYKKLMHNNKIEINHELIKVFEDINKTKHKLMSKDEMGDVGFIIYLKEELLKIESDLHVLTDHLVKYFYVRNSRFKETIWSLVGEIIYENLTRNLKGTAQCNNCPTRFEAKGNELLCPTCKVENTRKSWRDGKRKKRVPKAKTL
ncbi:hypothetical protein [Metasolibacillus meyeri]|uniref:hypothetical protein n=1 Tax=Metasolibacillus meyeri TaxID=1071052 RepID=UPI000D310233|nr:hypothetical protein [Metasolibacillus meyeri]